MYVVHKIVHVETDVKQRLKKCTTIFSFGRDTLLRILGIELFSRESSNYEIKFIREVYVQT